MSWLSDIIKGELEAEKQNKTVPATAEPSGDDLREMLRKVVKEEIASAIKETLQADAKAADKQADAKPADKQADAKPADKQADAKPLDIQAEIKKALAESLNSIPAKQRTIEESYDRVFNS